MISQFITVASSAQPTKPVINVYAETVNKQFTYSKSKYVSIKDRFLAATDQDWKTRKLAFSTTAWRSAYANVAKFQDLKLCKAQSTTLDKIVIDITLQRVLDIDHVCKILMDFQEVMVQSIQVYGDPAQPNNWVCWDGQHTAVVLYVVACLILGHDPADVVIPITIYDCSLKSKMRESFIRINSDAKKPLDPIDMFHQYLFGVRTDKSNIPKWLEADAKQQALETHGMFATHEKFGDVKQPGALSNLSEFIKLDSQMVLKVCKYFHAVCGSQRAVDSKEFWMMSEYFREAELQGIDVTDDFITEICRCLNTAFNGQYNPDALCQQATYSYEEWWRLNKPSANKPNADHSLAGIQRSPKDTTKVFLAAQIAKYADPRWNVPTVGWKLFQVDPKYLF
jgi:hypothetical protein